MQIWVVVDMVTKLLELLFTLNINSPIPRNNRHHSNRLQIAFMKRAVSSVTKKLQEICRRIGILAKNESESSITIYLQITLPVHGTTNINSIFKCK